VGVAARRLRALHCDHVLPALYERVFVPTAVVEELDHPKSLAAVRAWLTRLPSWLVVEQVAEAADVRLARLDPGERQAIQLRYGVRKDVDTERDCLRMQPWLNRSDTRWRPSSLRSKFLIFVFF
jgi:predicted nucleic acid-binding protein